MSRSHNFHLVKKLEKLAREDPSSTAFCPLAQIYLSQGELEKAETMCRKGLSSHPLHSPAYVILAEIHKIRGRNTDALKALNRAKELNPDNPKIYKLMAAVYRSQNDGQKTLSACKMLSLLRPDNKDALSETRLLEKLFSPAQTGLDSEEKTRQKGGNRGPPAVWLSAKQAEKLSKLNKILARAERLTDI